MSFRPEMAQKKMPPCYECNHRSPGCACDKYKNWKAEYKNVKKAIYKEIKNNSIYAEYSAHRAERARKTAPIRKNGTRI